MDHDPVTVLGLGAMGAALAGALLDRGHHTTVWNRTAARAEPLIARGATRAGTPARAVGASQLIVVCVSDHDAVLAVLDAAGGALAGRTVLNLGTGSPEQALAAAALATRHGADYLGGAAQAAPASIGTPDALLLHAGPQRTFDTHRATLEALGRAVHVGTEVDLAARYNLALLGLWYEAELAVLNAMTLIGAPDTDPAALAPLAATQLRHVVDTLPDVAGEVRDHRYPRGPASLAEHAPVLEQLVRLREARGLNVDQLRHVQGLVGDRIAAGHGAEGFTGVVAGLAPR